MNATGFTDDYNATFVGNESLDHSDVNHTRSFDYKYYDAVMSWISQSTIDLLSSVIMYVSAALGIPGNILSAIVWLRLHVTSKNSSAVYLAVLAINDLFFLPCPCLYFLIKWLHSSPSDILHSDVFYWSINYVIRFTSTFEPLLVLSFSVERVIAIVRPLQVCRYTVSYCLVHVVVQFDSLKYGVRAMNQSQDHYAGTVLIQRTVNL